MSRQFRPKRLRFEALEERIALYGNVTASVAHGVLTIKGDSLGNSLRIAEVSSGTVDVTGSEIAATTVNNKSGVVRFEGVRDIRASMGDGKDNVIVHTLTNSTMRTVSLDSGAGDDYVAVFHVETTQSVKVTGGSGNDIVSVGWCDTPTLKIDLGKGDNSVVFMDVSAGTVTVRSGAGIDTVEALSSNHDFVVLNKLDIGTGGGNDTITIGRVGDFKPAVVISSGTGDDSVNVKPFDSSTTINVKSLSITASDGNDSIAVQHLQSQGNLSISSGNPGAKATVNDTVTLWYVTTGGNLSVTAGKGNDQVWFDFVNVTGNATVKTGAGNDILGIGLSGSSMHDGLWCQNAYFDTSSGNDIVAAQWATFYNKVQVLLSSGTDSLLLFGGNNAVNTSAVRFDGGSGRDQLYDPYNYRQYLKSVVRFEDIS